MNDPSNDLTAVCTKAIEKIRQLLSSRAAPIAVALDGGSGAGKSTLASMIEKELDVALINLDDFYSADIPEHHWLKFSVEERLERVFDWQRLRESAIKPLLEGKSAKWNAFDFESGLRPDGTYGMQADPIEREPADIILIEGAYSSCSELADLVDLSILVDLPVEERHARLAARDGKAFMDSWHQRWDAVESYYFTQVKPRSSFDLVASL